MNLMTNGPFVLSAVETLLPATLSLDFARDERVERAGL